MRAATLESALDADFNRYTSAYRVYAIAGVRHMDDLADMADHEARPTVRRHAAEVGEGASAL